MTFTFLSFFIYFLQIADRHLSNFELCHQKGDIGQSFFSLSSAFASLPSLKEVYCSSFLEVFGKRLILSILKSDPVILPC